MGNPSSPLDDNRTCARVHDTLFVYGGGGDVTWNPQYDAYTDQYLEDKYSHKEHDGRRYMLDNMTSPNPRPNMMYEWKGYPFPEKGWRYSKETMARLDAEGRIWYPAGTSPEKRGKATGHLDFMDDWYPVQVKQKDKAGRPELIPLKR